MRISEDLRKARSGFKSRRSRQFPCLFSTAFIFRALFHEHELHPAANKPVEIQHDSVAVKNCSETNRSDGHNYQERGCRRCNSDGRKNDGASAKAFFSHGWNSDETRMGTRRRHPAREVNAATKGCDERRSEAARFPPPVPCFICGATGWSRLRWRDLTRAVNLSSPPRPRGA